MRTGLRKIKGFYLEKKKGKSVNYKAFDIIRNADKVKIIKKAGFYARLRRKRKLIGFYLSFNKFTVVAKCEYYALIFDAVAVK